MKNIKCLLIDNEILIDSLFIYNLIGKISIKPLVNTFWIIKMIAKAN